MTQMAHAHGYIRIRYPRLLAILALLHLPVGWLIESGDLPHSPECTETTGYLEGEDR